MAASEGKEQASDKHTRKDEGKQQAAKRARIAQDERGGGNARR
jgi:hypothetical protein